MKNNCKKAFNMMEVDKGPIIMQNLLYQYFLTIMLHFSESQPFVIS